MILTRCAVCATELGLSLGKKCGRCSTRYCGPACQKTHWEEGGHDKLCKKIKRGGGAEQYNADMKCAEAVAVAVEKCADDTKGQTCYICTQALHWKTKEGLVRGCSCRGTAGFAHVSCLAEQAKILVAEGEENNLGSKAMQDRWKRWNSCGLCEQRYLGVVWGALGWACWKTYVGRPEEDWTRMSAMRHLGIGLSEASHHEDALSVMEAELSMRRRMDDDEENILGIQTNLASTYGNLGRNEQALNMFRDVYSGRLKLEGEESLETLGSANNLAATLKVLAHFQEAKALLRKSTPVARRILGENHLLTLMMRKSYGEVLCRADGTTLDDLHESVATLEDTARTARRVLGGAHPTVEGIESSLRNSRALLRAREASSGSA